MGPLHGVTVIEIAGIGPGPYCGMLLSDLGADVIRVDRQKPGMFGGWGSVQFDVHGRGRRSIALDLKQRAGVEIVLRLVDRADALIEGFRPGVAERLGIGPESCLERNPKLVYGRMTGWGQEGPLAEAAGHDVNYISLTGALHAIGRDGEPPTIPLNVVGDFGGGAMFLALGVVAGLFEAARSGKGQVVDAAMVDGAASLISFLYGAFAAGFWQDRRSSNLLDGATHFYNVYETRDGKYVSIGSIDPQFYAELLARLELTDETLPGQLDAGSWPLMRERLAELFRTKTRDEWCEIMEGSDVCFAPVLSLGEAPDHAHMKARGAFVEVAGVKQPAPAPRFSRTPGEVRCPPCVPGNDTATILEEAGFSQDEIAQLEGDGVVTAARPESVQG